VKPVNPMKLAAVTANWFRRHVARSVILSELDPDRLAVLDVNAVNEPDLVRVGLHDDRVRADASPKKRTPFSSAPVVTPVPRR